MCIDVRIQKTSRNVYHRTHHSVLLTPTRRYWSTNIICGSSCSLRSGGVCEGEPVCNQIVPTHACKQLSSNALRANFMQHTVTRIANVTLCHPFMAPVYHILALSHLERVNNGNNDFVRSRLAVYLRSRTSARPEDLLKGPGPCETTFLVLKLLHHLQLWCIGTRLDTEQDPTPVNSFSSLEVTKRTESFLIANNCLAIGQSLWRHHEWRLLNQQPGLCKTCIQERFAKSLLVLLQYIPGLVSTFRMLKLSPPNSSTTTCRQQEPRTIFVGPAAPRVVQDAMVTQTWSKTSFDVRALIGKTQVVWVYDAVCKHSRIPCALKCYRKESQSQINYQYVVQRKF